MVQRKVPNKLGIQADHVKSEKRLGNPKRTSCQHQDGKSRGPDMKKKMKRSRSIKLSNIESLKSSPTLRKTMSQMGKPPPISCKATQASPQKQPINTSTGRSPNYMKATSSSEARKERSLVSSLITQNGSDRKNLRQRNSSDAKLSFASSNKPPRTLTKTSSLKLVRTLIKTPSFKLARGSTKKCSRVALYADMKVQRATCSSTLKESKFPAYLLLNHGGTDAEGTSVVKVCPYTYCSLNGHRHTPLPPLKCFLRARRRSLKAQKNTKFDVLSTHRTKLSGDGTKELNSQLLGISGERLPQMEADSVNLVKVPMIQEDGTDFFIEIYAQNGESFGQSTDEDYVQRIYIAEEPEDLNSQSSSYGDAEPAIKQGNSEQDADSLLAVTPQSEINFEGDHEQTIDEAQRNKKGFLTAEQMVDGAHTDYQPIIPQGALMEAFDNTSDIEVASQTSMGEDDDISEVTSMEWEDGQLSASDTEIETEYVNKPDDEYFSGIKNHDLFDDPEILKSEDITSNSTEEILADEVSRGLFNEDNASFGTEWSDSDSEMESTPQNLDSVLSRVERGDQSYDLYTSNEDAFEESIAMNEEDKEAETELISHLTTSPLEEPIAEKTEASENIQENEAQETEHEISKTISELGDDEDDCITEAQTDDTTVMFQNPVDDPAQSPNERGKVEITEDDSKDKEPKDAEVDQSLADSDFRIKQEIFNAEAKEFQLQEISQEGNSCNQLVDDSDTSMSHNQLFDGQQKSPAVVENQKIPKDKNDGANESKIPTSTDHEEQTGAQMTKMSMAAENAAEIDKSEVKVFTKSDTGETSIVGIDKTSQESDSKYMCQVNNCNQESQNTCNNGKWAIRSKKHVENLEEQRTFNPREPNFLPVVPDPEAERVDLRHQMMDDRKNAEEWMLDYALRKAVNNLAPARKRKVALLVEAFETVLPIPKYESQIQHASTSFSHTRPIQACS